MRPGAAAHDPHRRQLPPLAGVPCASAAMIPAHQISAAMEAGLRSWLLSRGCTPGTGTSLDQLALLAHNVRFRTLPTRAWKVHWSRDLKRSRLHAVNRHAVNAIVEKAERGLPLYAHQTARLKNAKHNDPLLSDWGIHHLHLNTAPDPKKPQFVERSDYVIFVFPVGEHLILLDILPHPHDEGWSDDRLINILHRDYPNAIARHRGVGVKELEMPITQQDRHNLRGNGAIVYTQVADGTIYFSPGGGYAVNGRSLTARIGADRTLWWAHACRIRDAILAENPDVPNEPPVGLTITFGDDLRAQLSATWTAGNVTLPEWPPRM